MWSTRTGCQSDSWSFHHPQRRPESLERGSHNKRISPHSAGEAEICLRNLVHVTVLLCIRRVSSFVPLPHIAVGVCENTGWRRSARKHICAKTGQGCHDPTVEWMLRSENRAPVRSNWNRIELPASYRDNRFMTVVKNCPPLCFYQSHSINAS